MSSGYAQWNQYTTYIVNDVVEYAGFIYAATATNRNVVPFPTNPTWTLIGGGGGGGGSGGPFLPLLGGVMNNGANISNVATIEGYSTAGFDTTIRTAVGTGNDLNIEADTGDINVDAFDINLNATNRTSVVGGEVSIQTTGPGNIITLDTLPPNATTNIVGYDVANKRISYFATPTSASVGAITTVAGGNNIVSDTTNPAIPIISLASPLTANLNMGTVDIVTTTANADIDFTTNGTGAVHITKANDTNATLRLTQTTTTTNAPPILEFYKSKNPSANTDVLGRIAFDGRDSAGNKQQYARIDATIRDRTAGATRDGSMELGCITNGSYANYIQLNGNDVPSGEVNILKPLDLAFGSSGLIKTSVAGGNINITSDGIGYVALNSASGQVQLNGGNSVVAKGANGVLLQTGLAVDRLKVLPTAVELAGVPLDTMGQAIKSTAGSLIVGGGTIYDTRIDGTEVNLIAGSSNITDRFLGCAYAGDVYIYRRTNFTDTTGPGQPAVFEVVNSPFRSLQISGLPIAPSSGISDGSTTGSAGQIITAIGGGNWQWQNPASPPTPSLSGVLSAGNSAGSSQINMDGNSIITSSGDFTIDASSSSGAGSISAILKSGANLIFQNLPTSNPGISGAVWNNGGVLNIV